MFGMRRPEEFSPLYYAAIRRHLQTKFTFIREEQRPLIIVLQRPAGKSRHLSNHIQLMAALSAAFPSEKYEVVVFDGSISLSDSISLFSRASLLLGPHGGSFLNALFAPSSAIVIEIAYPNIKEMPFPPYYYLQTCGLGLYHWIVFADEGSYTTAMTVNVAEVLQIIKLAWHLREKDLQSETNLQTKLQQMTLKQQVERVSADICKVDCQKTTNI